MLALLGWDTAHTCQVTTVLQHSNYDHLLNNCKRNCSLGIPKTLILPSLGPDQLTIVFLKRNCVNEELISLSKKVVFVFGVHVYVGCVYVFGVYVCLVCLSVNGVHDMFMFVIDVCFSGVHFYVWCLCVLVFDMFAFGVYVCIYGVHVCVRCVFVFAVCSCLVFVLVFAMCVCACL